MKNSSNHIIVHSPHGSHPGGKISLNSDSLDTGLHGLQGSDPGPMDSPKGSRHAIKVQQIWFVFRLCWASSVQPHKVDSDSHHLEQPE